MKVAGHKKQINFLIHSAKANLISQVYLFYGQSSIGKKRVALEFSKFIETHKGFTNESDNDLNCRDIEEDRHPDLKIINPQIKTEKGRPAIPIEVIKNLSSFLELKPLRAKRKIIIIDEAHLLNRDAQSALLKTLEEPKPNTIFFLITPYPQMLVSTIISRSSKLYFAPVELREIESYIINQKRINQKEAHEIAFFSFGKPGLALNFISSPQNIIKQKESFEKFVKIVKSDLFLKFALAKSISDNREMANEMLETWLKYFRLILLSRIIESSVYSKLIDVKAFSKFSNDDLMRIIKLIQRTKILLSTTNTNSKLALENLLINI